MPSGPAGEDENVGLGEVGTHVRHLADELDSLGDTQLGDLRLECGAQGAVAEHA